MRISDWSSDVCSSDLRQGDAAAQVQGEGLVEILDADHLGSGHVLGAHLRHSAPKRPAAGYRHAADRRVAGRSGRRSEEHTSELQSLMRISYAVFCLKKKKSCTTQQSKHTITNK